MELQCGVCCLKSECHTQHSTNNKPETLTEQTASHCNKQQPFDVYHTKPRVRCLRDDHLGISTNKCNDANNNGIILHK